MGSDGKQNTAKPVLGGLRIVALSISSHEQTAVFLKGRFSISEGSVFPDYSNSFYQILLTDTIEHFTHQSLLLSSALLVCLCLCSLYCK